MKEINDIIIAFTNEAMEYGKMVDIVMHQNRRGLRHSPINIADNILRDIHTYVRIGMKI